MASSSLCLSHQVPFGYLTFCELEAMTHRNRWCSYSKTDDFPVRCVSHNLKGYIYHKAFHEIEVLWPPLLFTRFRPGPPNGHVKWTWVCPVSWAQKNTWFSWFRAYYWLIMVNIGWYWLIMVSNGSLSFWAVFEEKSGPGWSESNWAILWPSGTMAWPVTANRIQNLWRWSTFR